MQLMPQQHIPLEALNNPEYKATDDPIGISGLLRKDIKPKDVNPIEYLDDFSLEGYFDDYEAFLLTFNRMGRPPMQQKECSFLCSLCKNHYFVNEELLIEHQMWTCPARGRARAGKIWTP